MSGASGVGALDSAGSPGPAAPSRRGSGVPAATWVAMVLLGLSGQIAWNIENTWLNAYIYDEITPDSRPIAVMVAVSAIIATVTTLAMGWWSDRVGRRKPFIVAGYVLWAASVAAFPAAAEVRAVTTAVALMVILDAVMTFFGSTANDAAFNAWVTDVTTERNRGTVDGVLQALPVVAVMIGMGASGLLIETFGYTTFFLVLAGVVLVMGLIGGALVREAHRDPVRPTAQPAPRDRGTPDLYLVFAAMALWGIGSQITTPYEVIYLNHTLGIDKPTVGIITAMVAPVLLLFAIPVGKLTDRGHGFTVLAVGFVLSAVGHLGFGESTTVLTLTAFAVVKSVGFLMMIVLMAWHRHLLPVGARGAFQGVRLIFMVLIPMLIGPGIGSLLIRATGEPAVVDGQAGHLPPSEIYLAGATVVLLAIVPVVLLRRRRGGIPPGLPPAGAVQQGATTAPE